MILKTFEESGVLEDDMPGPSQLVQITYTLTLLTNTIAVRTEHLRRMLRYPWRHLDDLPLARPSDLITAKHLTVLHM